MLKKNASQTTKAVTFVAPRPRLKQERGFYNKSHIKCLVLIDKSDFCKVDELTDVAVVTVISKAIQHVSSLMAELGFLAVSSCYFPGHEN